MPHVRACFRLLFIFLCTIVYFVVFLLTPKKFKFFLCASWARSCTFILGMKTTVYGEIPPPPFFLVTNHLSYIDIIFLWSKVKAVFVSKDDVVSWPLIGFIAKSLGTIFVQRSATKNLKQVNKDISECFDKGYGVIVFPEGTSSDGTKVLPFRSPLLNSFASKEIQKPVNFACLRYENPSDGSDSSETICWWKINDSLLRHFYRLCGIKRFDAKIYFGEKTLKGSDRKELGRSLHLEVQTLHDRLSKNTQ